LPVIGSNARSKVRRATWLVLVLLYVAAFATGVYGVVRPAGSGVAVARIGSAVVVHRIEAGSEPWYEGVQVGDLVLAIDGQDPLAHTFDGQPFDGQPMESITVKSAQTDATKTIHIIQRASSLIDEAVSLNLLGLVFLLMGLFAFLRAQPTSQIASFSFLSVAAAIALAIAPASIANHAWARILQGMALYQASIYFAFFFPAFARKEPMQAKSVYRWIPEISALLATISLVPWAMTALGIVDIFSGLRAGVIWLLAVALISGTAVLIRQFKTADPDTREQMRIAAVGTVLGLVPFLWLSILPQLLAGREIVRAETTVLGLVLLPLGFGYAILRHQLMGIRHLVHRGAVYALITTGIIVVYGSAISVVNIALPNSESYAGLETGLLVLLFISVPLLSTVRRRALGVIDRLLYKDVIDPQDLVRAVSAYAASEDNLGRLLNRTLAMMTEGLGLQFAVAVVVRPGGTEVAGQSGETTPEIIASIRRIAGEPSRGVQTAVLPNAGREIEVLLGAAHGMSGTRALLVLGPKRSEETFDQEQVQLLQTTCGVLSASMARTQLMEEVRSQSDQLQAIGSQLQHVQEEERAEISSYLHDQPLQKVAFALAQMRERSLPEDLAQLLEDVAKDLRSTSAALSPDILREAGLVASVRWLVQEQQGRTKSNIMLDFEGLSQADRFSDDIELAAYRTVQEALNNCLKHANARSVWVRLARSAEGLEVRIEDNGVGIRAEGGVPGKGPEEGLGLRGLKHRISALGGNLTLMPRASRGAALLVTLPLKDSTAASLRRQPKLAARGPA